MAVVTLLVVEVVLEGLELEQAYLFLKVLRTQLQLVVEALVVLRRQLVTGHQAQILFLVMHLLQLPLLVVAVVAAPQVQILLKATAQMVGLVVVALEKTHRKVLAAQAIHLLPRLRKVIMAEILLLLRLQPEVAVAVRVRLAQMGFLHLLPWLATVATVLLLPF